MTKQKRLEEGDMRFEIGTHRHGTLSFFCPEGGGPIYLEDHARGKVETQGRQICWDGTFMGIPLSTPEENFKATCRSWYRAVKRWRERGYDSIAYLSTGST